jgi:hypothetical protein
VIDDRGQPSYLGKREAAIRVWFTESIEHSDLIDLTNS